MLAVGRKFLGGSHGRASPVGSSSQEAASVAAGAAAGGVRYFYGRITRDEAETALRDAGLDEGLYLLRESVDVAGNYALSICHNGKVHHYCIDRQPDGQVMIPDGRLFPGPVELIHHHSQYLDGFLTKPRVPCNRPDGFEPLAWPGVTMMELDLILLEEAEKQKITKPSDLQKVLGPQRLKYVSTVAKWLHREQPWFHGDMEREEAEKVMAASGHVDGKFLMRAKSNGTSYALSVSYQNQTKHYRIVQLATTTGTEYAIENGPPFQNFMDLVAHYYNRMDGLLCKLTRPCVRKGFVRKKRKRVTSLQALSENTAYSGVIPSIGGQVVDRGIGRSVIADNADLDEPEVPYVATRPLPPLPVTHTAVEMEEIYDSVRSDAAKKGMKKLKRADMELGGMLGKGNFGSVERGTYHQRNRAGKVERSIPVAVKILKSEDLQTAESEMMAEAQIMAELDHRHIVRMIGICHAENIMLVLELANLGPLNTFLKKQRIPMSNVIELMQQVAQGMAYLEEKKFVHRDLAARNVLLVDEHYAKISDFGLSRTLGMDNQIYKAQSAGRWPIKWYAPECILFHTFDSKSDVWSYGIVLWEATTYGGKPYAGLRGADLITFVCDEGRRMDKPPDCPDKVYDVMLQCWQRLQTDRPTFKQLVQIMTRLLT